MSEKDKEREQREREKEHEKEQRAREHEKQQREKDPEAPGVHTPSRPDVTATQGAAGATGVPPRSEAGVTDVLGAPGQHRPQDREEASDDEARIRAEPSYWAGVRAAQSAIAREDTPFGSDDYQRELWLKGWDFAQAEPEQAEREREQGKLEDKGRQEREEREKHDEERARQEQAKEGHKP